MIKRFLESLEDPYRVLFGPNYLVLNKIGMLLPKNAIKRFFKIMLHVIGTIFVITQYIELFLIKSDLNMVLTNLTLSMQSTVCVIKAWSFLLWQDKWRQVIEYITEADKFERDNQDITKQNIIKSYTKYSRRITYIYFSMGYSLIATVATSLMVYITSEFHRESVRNETVPFPHIFSSWVPFDKDSSPGCWITVAWHTGLCFYGVTTVGAYDSAVTVMLVFFGARFDLLSVRCREMLGTDGKGVSDEDSDKALREIHNIHVLHLKYSRILNSVSSPVMFCYIIMCSVMICATAFQLSTSTDTGEQVLMADFLYLLLFSCSCFVGMAIRFCRSQGAEMEPYNSQWWAANIRQRKNVLLLQGQLGINLNFTAGPFTNLTLATFVAVLKGAYSYYTMVRQN